MTRRSQGQKVRMPGAISRAGPNKIVGAKGRTERPRYHATTARPGRSSHAATRVVDGGPVCGMVGPRRMDGCVVDATMMIRS